MRRRKRKASYLPRIGIFLLLCIVSAFLFSAAATAEKSGLVEVSLQAENVEILQEEEIPKFTVKVKTKGEKNPTLDEESGYTVEELVAEFEKGENYTVVCEADNTKEGEQKIEVKLNDDFQNRLLKDWLGKVDVVTKDGTLTVKNKYGTWDGEKFQLYDGTYAKNMFISSQGKSYYFGEDENKVSGWQTIGTDLYCFDKKGVMKTGWQKEEEGTYYLQADGKATLGWLELDGEKYYFNQEHKMVTGELQIGSKKCEFAEDGKLTKMEDRLDPNKPMIALTFDDGPGKRTGEILDVLEANDARATFFMVGPNAKLYPDLVKRIYDTGSELGNHSTNHPQLTKISPEKIQEEMNITNDAVQAAAGMKPTVMRPPYGAINDTVKANVGLPMIMWSIDTLDWKSKNVEAIKNATYSNLKDGDIILLHDIHNASVDAAKQMIPELIAKGYQLVTVSELAEARGITMENGGRYAEFYKD